MNNGTVNANVTAQDIPLDTESELQNLVAPELADTVLAPGESCTFTFVVSVEDTENPVLDENEPVTVTLSHVQDTVEPAPEPSYVH